MTKFIKKIFNWLGIHWWKFKEPAYLKTEGGGDIPFGMIYICKFCIERKHLLFMYTMDDIKRNYKIFLKYD